MFNRAIAFITRSVPVSNCTVGKKLANLSEKKKTNDNGERKERPGNKESKPSSRKEKVKVKGKGGGEGQVRD